jgi:acetyltransferase-like isoleucine patch superfamily enzyme
VALEPDSVKLENIMPAKTISYPGIAAGATIAASASIAPDVVIMDGAEIGADCTIEPGVIIYENVRIGEGTLIGAQCILGERLSVFRKDPAYVNPTLELGPQSTIRSGTIIYAGCKMGIGFQTGHRAVIRERSIFGDNCSFGTLSQSDGDITVGNNCRFHNNVFIATYTTIEDNVHFYPMSCTVDSLHPPCQRGRQGPYVEAGVTVGAKVLILPRVRIGSGAIIAGASVVSKDVPSRMVAAGVPARTVKARSDVRCHLENRPAYEP